MKSSIRILLLMKTVTIVMGSCPLFVAQPIQAQVMHPPVGSRWKCHIEYESSVAIKNNVWDLSGEITAVFDGEFRLKRAASAPSLQTAFIDFMERIATLTEAGVAAGKDEATITAEMMKIEEPLKHDLEGIEGKISGTIINSQGPSHSNLGILAVECPALPKKSFPVEGLISGGFSLDGILLQVSSGGWQDPRKIECGSKVPILPDMWATFKSSDSPLGRMDGFGQFLEYKNGEQRFESKMENTDARGHVVNKFNLTSECPVSTSSTDACSVMVHAEKPPTNPPDNTLTKAQLGAKRSAYKNTLPGDLLGGWTVPHPTDDHSHPRMQLVFEWRGCNANFGSNVCLWLETLNLAVSLPVDMYVAKEYPMGSCKYNVIFVHEKKHVDSYYEILDKHAKAMRAALENADWIPSKGNPLSIAPVEAESARKAVENRVKDLVMAIFHNEYIVAMNKSDVEVDMPTELARVDEALRACDAR